MDFSALSDLEVTFTSGSPSGTQQSVDIAIMDDGALEGDHEFRVQLISTDPSGSSVMIGMQSITTVTITDNEGKVSFACTDPCKKTSMHVIISSPPWQMQLSPCKRLVQYWKPALLSRSV